MHNQPTQRTLSRALFAAVSSMAVLSVAHAEDVKTLDESGVTASVLKLDVVPEETPQTVNVIDDKTLESHITRKVDDALRYTPGFVNPYGADYDTNWMRMRGFAVTTLVDGHVQYQEGFFDTTVEPFGLEAVEVVSGPASSLYGDSQPGGVVNLVTKKPGKTPEKRVTLTGGTNDFVQGGLDVTGFITEDGSQRYRLVATAGREDSFLNDVDGWRAYVAPSWTLDISPDTSITLLASYLKDRKTPSAAFFPVWGTVLPRHGAFIDPSTNYGDPEHDLYDKDQATLGWEFKHAFNENLEYKQSFGAKRTSLFLRSTAAYGSLDGASAPSDDGLYRSTLVNDGTQTSFNFENTLTGTWETESFENVLQVGFDYEDHKNDWLGNGLGTALPNVDPFNPSYSGLPATSELTLWKNAIRKRQAGLFAQGQTIWSETILAKAGLRYDRVNIKAENDDPNAISGKDEMDDGQLSFNAGLMLLTDAGLSPYVNYSQAFFTNASMVQLGGYAPKTYSYRIYEPVKTEQTEVGLKYAPKGSKVVFNVALFDLKQKNALAQTVIGGVLAQSQVAQKRSRGVEVSGTVRPTTDLTVRAAYTFQKVTKPDYVDAYGQTHNEAEFSPEHVASLWADYKLTAVGAPNVTIGNGLRYLGSSVDTYYRHKVDAALLWDANVVWDVNRSWTVTGTASNIANKRYIAGADWNTAYYGEGRVLRVNLDYRF